MDQPKHFVKAAKLMQMLDDEQQKCEVQKYGEKKYSLKKYSRQ